jgi:protein-tyrosine phosphatase
MKPRILFVCGRNQWRSPTAQHIYRDDPRVDVRSAGVSEKSSHRISNADLDWADLILTMESEHASRIRKLFGNRMLPEIKSLEIPDEYQYMDEDLIELIRSGTEVHIQSLTGKA